MSNTLEDRQCIECGATFNTTDEHPQRRNAVICLRCDEDNWEAEQREWEQEQRR